MIFDMGWINLSLSCGRVKKMIKSISVGKYISVQGLFVRESANGRIVVRVGERTYEGKPVSV